MEYLFAEKQQQRQQKQPQQNEYNREEEYLSAQRAAVEAVSIGRETLETTVRQGEQLQNAETMASETEYKLDKANRLLRGMTWSGWIANKFSRDVEPPEYKRNGDDNNSDIRNILGPPKVYDDVPELCSSAAQAIQNYHANLQVLEDCETDEQRETCKLICDNMHRLAVKEVDSLKSKTTESDDDNNNNNSLSKVDSKTLKFALRLQQDIETLRHRQLTIQQLQRGLTATGSATASTDMKDPNRAKLFQGAKEGSTTDTSSVNSGEKSPIDQITKKQDDHLDFMATHLHELGSLAGHLNISLAQHSDTLETLDEKNDSMMFKTKMVTRRADRIIQKKSWVKEKAEFIQYATIKHLPTGRYFSVAPNNDTTLVLSGVLNERCIFGIWKRKSVFGLQNQYNMKWAGQNMLGNLACSASTFGRREEWDTDDDWTNTTLVVASAGWGHGGYLLFDKEGNGTLPMIGGGTLEDKKQAPRWCIHPFEKK